MQHATGDRWWLAAARRTARKLRQDELADRAASLTYYSVLAIFPGLLVLVSLLGLLGQRSQSLISNLATIAPASVRQTVLSAVSRLEQGHAAASFLVVAGLVVASGRHPDTSRRSCEWRTSSTGRRRDDPP
ncbi:MAG TPA: YhjD/YihY/BrkB family envelope integrity protein [Streptosporangiaceae bacterium]